MAYTKQTWTDGSGGGTPLSATRLNYLETGVQSAAAAYGWALNRLSTTPTSNFTADTANVSLTGAMDNTVHATGVTVQSLTKGQVLIPVTGLWVISLTIDFSTAFGSGKYANAYICKSATSGGTPTVITKGADSPAATNTSTISAYAIELLTAGTYVNPGFYSDAALAITGNANGTSTRFTGALIAAT